MNIKETLLFFLFSVSLLVGNHSQASMKIVSGDAFSIEMDDKSLLPLFFVDKKYQVALGSNKVVHLEGDDVNVAKQKIRSELSKQYSIISVRYFSVKQLQQITVLGDIDNPGNYIFPENSRLTELNSFARLYTEAMFDSSITLIRHGKRLSVSAENYGDYRVQKSDVLLISLSRKPAPPPKPQVVKREKPAVVKKVEVKPVEALAPTVDPKIQENPLLKDIAQSYLLQPGDILTIGLPGEEGFNTEFLIERDGTIKLPEVGILKVADMPLEEIEKAAYKLLANAFLGLDKLTVFLKEKRLLITVLGYVTKPGEVDLPSSGNVQMAINEAGGLENGAQLDKLQLQRNGETSEFNFKRYMDTGDISMIPELKSLDVIFIPSSPELGNVHGEASGDGDDMDTMEDRTAVKVFGEVIKPSSFPYKAGMNLVDAILKAGGVTRYANVEQIRVIDKGGPTLFNLKSFLDNGDQASLLVLSEGATIFVPKQVDAVQGGGRVVYVMGQVQKPGSFETGNNVSFLDVLANAGGPNRYADTRTVKILRANGGVESFNLQDYAEGVSMKLPQIMPGDAIFIPEKGPEDDQSWLKLASENSVKLLGAIKKPGRYEWSEKITFMDLLGHAGGPNDKADLAHVKIIAPGETGQVESITFDMEKFIEKGGSWSQMPILKGGSTIIFPELPRSPTDNNAQWVRLPKEQSIYIMGAVQGPGRFAFNDNLGFLDILAAADGPSKDADLSKIRIVHRGEGSPRVTQLNLIDYFETGDESLLPKVKTGDSIYVPSLERNWIEKKKEDTVRVLGAVTTSGRYEFMNEMTILDLLAEAGGPTKTAYIEKIIIVNTSCCKNQAYTFDLMDFMKDPDASRLPILRAGDTVYVADTSMSYWSILMDAIKDSLSVLSLVAIVKGF